MVGGPDTHTDVPQPAAGSRPSPKRWLWGLGCGTLGCGTLACGGLIAVLVVGGIGFLGVSAFNAVQACVPSDFPVYPGSFWDGWQGGMGADCRDSHLTLDDVNHVFTFYSSRLSEGDWRITAIHETVDRIDFARTTGTQITGSLWVWNQGPFRAICTDFSKATSVRASLFVDLVEIGARARGGNVCAGGIPQGP